MARTECRRAARQALLPEGPTPVDVRRGDRPHASHRTTRPILIIHSSDDMYGADRMVLEVIGALSAEDRARVVVWLPTDYEHGPTPLCEELAAGGINCEHLPLPILRRRYLNASGLSAMGGRVLETRRLLAEMNPSDIILATSAVLPHRAVPRAAGQSTRVFLHMQEVWQGREGRVLGGLAARVDRIIAISEASKASLPERPAGADGGGAQRHRGAGERGPRARTTRAALIFVTASRWNTWKGHEVLIRAWDAADCPGTLVILGGPPAMGGVVDVRLVRGASRRPDTIEIRGEVTGRRCP